MATDTYWASICIDPIGPIYDRYRSCEGINGQKSNFVRSACRKACLWRKLLSAGHQRRFAAVRLCVSVQLRGWLKCHTRQYSADVHEQLKPISSILYIRANAIGCAFIHCHQLDMVANISTARPQPMTRPQMPITPMALPIVCCFPCRNPYESINVQYMGASALQTFVRLATSDHPQPSPPNLNCGTRHDHLPRLSSFSQGLAAVVTLGAENADRGDQRSGVPDIMSQ